MIHIARYLKNRQLSERFGEIGSSPRFRYCTLFRLLLLGLFVIGVLNGQTPDIEEITYRGDDVVLYITSA